TVGERVDRAHERVDALLVAEEARHVALARPAAVAVHDEGDVAGDRAGIRAAAVGEGRAGRGRLRHALGYTAMTSASLPCTSLSIWAIVPSVRRCTSSCARRSSSSVAVRSFSIFFKCSFASRRMLRTAIF